MNFKITGRTGLREEHTMAKTNTSSDQYDNKNKSVFPFYDRFFVSIAALLFIIHVIYRI